MSTPLSTREKVPVSRVPFQVKVSDTCMYLNYCLAFLSPSFISQSMTVVFHYSFFFCSLSNYLAASFWLCLRYSASSIFHLNLSQIYTRYSYFYLIAESNTTPSACGGRGIFVENTCICDILAYGDRCEFLLGIRLQLHHSFSTNFDNYNLKWFYPPLFWFIIFPLEVCKFCRL